MNSVWATGERRKEGEESSHPVLHHFLRVAVFEAKRLLSMAQAEYACRTLSPARPCLRSRSQAVSLCLSVSDARSFSRLQ